MKNTSYLLVGNGRLSKHLQYYFSKLDLNFSVWERSEGFEKLLNQAEQATHILLLISDSAIHDFYDCHFKSTDKTVIHFSGALEIPGIIGIHPLMTFGHELYDLSFYEQIPFVTTVAGSSLPGLRNQVYQIKKEDKAYYHALCVIGGNLTSLLTSKIRNGMMELGLPENISKPFVQKSIENVYSNPKGFFTGPLARKDVVTIQRNLSSLQNDPYQNIYKAFLNLTIPEFLDKNKEGVNENTRL